MSAATFRSRRPRSAGSSLDHDGSRNAFSAAATAARASSSVAAGTFAVTDWSKGFTSGRVAPSLAPTHAPPMNIFSSLVIASPIVRALLEGACALDLGSPPLACNLCRATRVPASLSMKLLLTVHRYWPSIGGTEALVEGLARKLVARGNHVTVATSDEPGAPDRETRGGVEIRRFELKRAGKFRFPPRTYRQFVAEGGWDLVVCHGQRVWNTDYVLDVARRSRTPFVLMAHGFYQYHMGSFRAAE